MTVRATALDPSTFGAGLESDRIHLRLLATTDIHLNLWPYDYFADRADDTVGLALVAGLVRDLRQSAANTLLLDNGDMLQGTPMADCLVQNGAAQPDVPHPAIAAMNVMGYDAATLGNHDFNYGLDHMLTAYGAARFPVVSANVAWRCGADPTDDVPLVPPTARLYRRVRDAGGRTRELVIGVIGFLPPQIIVWDRQQLAGRVQTRCMIEAARAHVPVLRAQGCDLVIALAHSGIAGDGAGAPGENAVGDLAEVPGIDALIAGHVHQVFPGSDVAASAAVDPGRGTVAGVPTVSAGFWGSHLGRIDLALRVDGAGCAVERFDVGVHPIAPRGPRNGSIAALQGDPEVLRATETAHRNTLTHIRRPVGRSDAPLFSHFAQVAGDPTVRYVNHAQCAHVTRALAVRPEARLPLLSAAAPFKVGARGRSSDYIDIPAGNLALRHVAELYLHPNQVRAVLITGAELRTWLERSAGQFLRLRPGVADQPLLDPTFPSYNFDVIDGLSYVIDPSQPARFDRMGRLTHPDARRITALRHCERPIDPAQQFVVVTNSFRAAGGGGFPAIPEAQVIYAPPLASRDVVLEQIALEGTISPVAKPTWRFAALPGTSVLFDTGPGAMAHLSTVAHLRPEDLGRTAEGFQRLRLHL